MNGPLQLVEEQAKHTLYVVDQRNTLDLDGGADMKKYAKRFAGALDSIDQLRYSQRYIFSASVNQQSDGGRERNGAEL